MDGGGVVKEVQQVVRHRLLPPTMPCSLFVSFCSACIMYTDYVYIVCITLDAICIVCIQSVYTCIQLCSDES